MNPSPSAGRRSSSPSSPPTGGATSGRWPTNPDTLIAYPDGVESGRISPWRVAELVGLDSDPAVMLGWMPAPPPWIEDPALRGYTILGGYGLADAIETGRIAYLPVRLGTVPRLLASVHRPTVAVVAGVRRGSGFAYRGTVGWGPAAVASASAVVVEVDERAPDLGAPLIDASVDHVVEVESTQDAAPIPRAVDEVDLAVGRNVAVSLPEDIAIQLGPGGIAEAIVQSIERPVRVQSGLITETMAELGRRDLLSGVARAGYVWGGEAIAELAAQGRLELQPVEITHDVGRLAQIPGLIACNTALQVGLDGSVNVERVGGRLVAGIGGHADFCAGAARSPGGLSIIALRSTTRRGLSTIVPRVDVVSTPRCDVDLVVTEHGVADLRGVDDAERARRIASVAAPEHRELLRADEIRPARAAGS